MTAKEMGSQDQNYISSGNHISGKMVLRVPAELFSHLWKTVIVLET